MLMIGEIYFVSDTFTNYNNKRKKIQEKKKKINSAHLRSELTTNL